MPSGLLMQLLQHYPFWPSLLSYFKSGKSVDEARGAGTNSTDSVLHTGNRFTHFGVCLYVNEVVNTDQI